MSECDRETHLKLYTDDCVIDDCATHRCSRFLNKAHSAGRKPRITGLPFQSRDGWLPSFVRLMVIRLRVSGRNGREAVGSGSSRPCHPRGYDWLPYLMDCSASWYSSLHSRRACPAHLAIQSLATLHGNMSPSQAQQQVVTMQQ